MTQNEIAEIAKNLTEAIKRHESFYGKIAGDFVYSAIVTAITEALSLKGEEVNPIQFSATLNGKTEVFTFSDITVAGIANNEIYAKGILLSAQGIDNPDVKISVIGQHSTPSPVEYGNRFSQPDVPRVMPSPNPLLEEVKKRLGEVEHAIFMTENHGERHDDALILQGYYSERTIYTELIQFTKTPPSKESAWDAEAKWK